MSRLDGISFRRSMKPSLDRSPRWIMVLVTLMVAATAAGCLGSSPGPEADAIGNGSDGGTQERGGNASASDTLTGSPGENVSDHRAAGRDTSDPPTIASVYGEPATDSGASVPDYDAERLPPTVERLNYTTSARDDDIEETRTSGVYVADVDRDGLTDLLAIGGEAPVLFGNTGDGFVRWRDFDVDAEIGSALFFDHEGDGWQDLLLLNLGSSNKSAVFYHNDDGTLVRRDVGLDRSFAAPRGATAADFDGDGCLDVYVYQANLFTEVRPAGWGENRVALDEDNGEPNAIFDGDCERFERVEASVGGGSWSLAASAVDLTGDGLPDLHVANDFNRDVVYVNRGDWRFERRPLGDATNRNGMSSTVGDVDRDGLPDLFVSNIYLPDEGRSDVLRRRYGDRFHGNNLLINQGNGSFTDRAASYGVRRGLWGWAAVLEDLDNDGDDDLVQTTGQAVGAPRARNLFWRRDGDRFRLAAVPGLTAPLSTVSVARLDVDHDGRQDLVFGKVDGPFYRYEASPPDEHHWLDVDVRSEGSPVLGTEVTVSAGGQEQTERVHASTDYRSQGSRVLHFGLDASERATVEAVFPDGHRVERTVSADQRIVITPGEG